MNYQIPSLVGNVGHVFHNAEVEPLEYSLANPLELKAIYGIEID